MKYLQGKYMTGFVTLIVSGNHPELFLQQLVNEKIYVWEIKKINAHCCQAYVRRFDKKNILSIAQRSSYEITFENDHGLPRVINYFKQQKEIVIASLISVIVFICLSQVIWSIEISGVSQEIEVKINDHLKNNGIKRGAIKPLLDNPSTMQQQLLLDIPELLWVGVEQKGTTLKFSGIEKISHDSETTDRPQHLIAKKNGTIEKMHITKGVPLVSVNDYVTIGKRLVSGNLSDVIESEEDNEPTNDQEQLVAAQGEIFARTWYEIQVTVPLSVNYEHISERKIDKYYISFQNKRLLLWGFQQPNYSDIHTTTDEYTLNIFNRTFPFKFIKQSIYEKEQINYVRSKKEAIQVGMLEAEAALKLQLSANAKILSQKVLHEATGSGKVRLNLLITVSEDIAEEIPITQGD